MSTKSSNRGEAPNSEGLSEKLQRLANEVVLRTQAGMPEELAGIAESVPVLLRDRPGPETIAQGFEADILGLFVGEGHAVRGQVQNPSPACIILFLGSLWDYTEGDERWYRDEVRITYLHELGHYLGWDEEELASRGLG